MKATRPQDEQGEGYWTIQDLANRDRIRLDTARGRELEQEAMKRGYNPKIKWRAPKRYVMNPFTGHWIRVGSQIMRDLEKEYGPHRFWGNEVTNSDWLAPYANLETQA